MQAGQLFGFNAATEVASIDSLVFQYEKGKDLLKPIMEIDTENYDPDARCRTERSLFRRLFLL